MAANTTPIYSRYGDVTTDGSTGMAQAKTAAAANYTGDGANNFLIWTADSSNGGFIQAIRGKAIGSNVASVLRLFLNNGATNATATNNAFFGEISLPVTTASNVAATNEIDYPINKALPAGFRIYGGLATAVAAGWVFVPWGGKY